MATFTDKSDFVQYEKRIQRHKKQKLLILLGILLVAAAICVYLIFSLSLIHISEPTRPY